MFCKNCGKEIDDKAAICPNCGVPTETTAVTPGATHNAADAPSTGFAFLGFFFPLVGLILFLCFQKTTPVRAKAIGKWALIGFIVGVALSVLRVLFA